MPLNIWNPDFQRSHKKRHTEVELQMQSISTQATCHEYWSHSHRHKAPHASAPLYELCNLEPTSDVPRQRVTLLAPGHTNKTNQFVMRLTIHD